MNRLLNAFVGCLVVVVLLVPLVGCKDREPMPIHTIVIKTPGNGFLFDGIPMMSDQLRTELVTLADSTRSSSGFSARAYVRISAEDGVSFDRVYEWVNTCNSLGLDKIETAGH